jgi:hypothetical protein
MIRSVIAAIKNSYKPLCKTGVWQPLMPRKTSYFVQTCNEFISDWVVMACLGTQFTCKGVKQINNRISLNMTFTFTIRISRRFSSSRESQMGNFQKYWSQNVGQDFIVLDFFHGRKRMVKVNVIFNDIRLLICLTPLQVNWVMVIN